MWNKFLDEEPKEYEKFLDDSPIVSKGFEMFLDDLIVDNDSSITQKGFPKLEPKVEDDSISELLDPTWYLEHKNEKISINPKPFPEEYQNQ